VRKRQQKDGSLSAEGAFLKSRGGWEEIYRTRDTESLKLRTLGFLKESTAMYRQSPKHYPWNRAAVEKQVLSD
jgi:hypothetical protein